MRCIGKRVREGGFGNPARLFMPNLNLTQALARQPGVGREKIIRRMHEDGDLQLVQNDER